MAKTIIKYIKYIKGGLDVRRKFKLVALTTAMVMTAAAEIGSAHV